MIDSPKESKSLALLPPLEYRPNLDKSPKSESKLKV